MRIVMLFVMATLLAGCATTAEKAAQQKRQVDQMIAVYGPACEKLGYPANSDTWRDCILRLDARDNYPSRNYPTMTNCIRQGPFLNCTNF